jgi:hypothetical protein
MRFQTAEEFHQKACNCYVLTDLGGIIPTQVAFLGHRRDDGLLFYLTKDTSDVVPFKYSPHIELYTPKLGYMKKSKGSGYDFVARVPSRRYKVGITNENLNKHVLTPSYKSNLERLEEIRAGRYATIHHGLGSDHIQGISMKYGLSRDGVYYQDDRIASIHDGRITYNSESEMYFHHNNLVKFGVNLPHNYQQMQNLSQYAEEYDV